MKTLNKVLLFDTLISLLFRSLFNVNLAVPFILTLILYGLFIIIVSINGAMNVKNADSETIERYITKLNKYK